MAIGVVERRERRERRQSCSVLEQRKGGGENSKQVLGRVWREAVSRGARRASRRGRPSSSLGVGTGWRGAEPRCGENGQVERVCFARIMENEE